MSSLDRIRPGSATESNAGDVLPASAPFAGASAREREHEHRQGGTQEASPRRVAGPVRARLLEREEHAADGGAKRGGEARGDPRGEEIARVLVVTKGVEAFAAVRGEDDAVADDEALLPREETCHARADVHEGSLGSDGKARGHGEDRPEHLDEGGGQGEEPRDVDAVEARHDERDSGAGCGGRDAEHEEGGGDGEEHGGGDGDGGRGEKAARRIVRVGVEDTLDDREPRAGVTVTECSTRKASAPTAAPTRSGRPIRHASGVSTGSTEGTVVDDLVVQGLEVTDFLAPVVARAEPSVRLVVAAASGRGWARGRGIASVSFADIRENAWKTTARRRDKDTAPTRGAPVHGAGVA